MVVIPKSKKSSDLPGVLLGMEIFFSARAQ